MPSRRRASGVALAALLALGSPAVAHEFWIQPETFTPQVGERVPVRLFVGSGDERSELPRMPEHLLLFDAVRPAGSAPVVGLPGRVPAGFVVADAPGTWIVAYRSRHTFVELPAEKFEAYLEEEGLDRIVSERVRRDESLAPGRESFARYAKALLVAGGASAPSVGFDLEVGLPIELLPDTDPRAWREGDPLTVRLLYEGRPLADQQVKLIHLIDHELALVYRTDVEGRARLQPPEPGPWLIASVFLRRAPAGIEGDWESFWASLTLSLPGQGEPSPARSPAGGAKTPAPAPPA